MISILLLTLARVEKSDYSNPNSEIPEQRTRVPSYTERARRYVTRPSRWRAGSRFPFYYYNYCYFSNRGLARATELGSKSVDSSQWISLPPVVLQQQWSACCCRANHFNVSFTVFFVYLSSYNSLSCFLLFCIGGRQPKRAGNAKVPNGDRCTIRWHYDSINTRRLVHILSIYRRSTLFRMVSTETIPPN